MKTVYRRPVIPIYGAALWWVIWCLFFPLWQGLHWCILIFTTAAVWGVLRLIFRGKTVEIPIPEEPRSTGDKKLDALCAEGALAVKELRRLSGSIREESVKKRGLEIADVTERIFQDLLEDPSDYPQIRRFSSYFLPATIKLLNAYDRMSGEAWQGENVHETMTRIEGILDTTLSAYRKELDALFANEALDIDTDITVLESMLAREGLSGEGIR